MMCIKHVLVYFLLLPIPAASPLFLFLFAAAAFIAIKPCGYCLSLLAILFLATSPHSPFLSNPTPPLSFPSTPLNTTVSQLPLDTPIPNRSWFSLNGGRLGQPSLVGYEEMDRALVASLPEIEKGWKGLTRRFFAFEMARSPSDRVLSSAEAGNAQLGTKASKLSLLDQIVAPYLTASSAINEPQKSSAAETKIRTKRELPRNHVDLSWKGIGLIVDFGWRRSEEGVRFEIEEALGREWVRPLPPTETEEEDHHDAEESGYSSTTKADETSPTVEHEQPSTEVETRLKGTRKFWNRIPLVGGSW